MTSPSIDRFVESTSATPARLFTAAINDMLVAVAMDNGPAWNDARRQLGIVARETMGVATVLGAQESLRRAAKLITESDVAFQKGAIDFTGLRSLRDNSLLLTFADGPSQTIVPSVTFQEALINMVERTPVTIRDAAKRTAENIARLYGEGLGNIQRVAFVRSAEQAVTKRVQSLIAEAIDKGIPELDFTRAGVLKPGAGSQIKDAVNAIRKKTGAWSKSYSRMVFRTNVNTAITAGRFAQGLDPDIEVVMPAVEFNTAGDSDVRKPSHSAGDGFIALRRNRIWGTHAPPIDYNCRCSVRDVGLPELRRMGRVRGKPTSGFTRVGLSAVFIREDRPDPKWQPNPEFRQGVRIDLGTVPGRGTRPPTENLDPGMGEDF